MPLELVPYLLAQTGQETYNSPVLLAGYGFAVPVQLAKRVADDLIRYGAVHRPRLGVAIDDVHPADVEVYRLPSANGAVVKTDPEGPAKEAGVRLGDVIVAVNGGPIEDTSDLMESIALLQPGDRVTLDLIRYGKVRRPILGVTIDEMTPEQVKYSTSWQEGT